MDFSIRLVQDSLTENWDNTYDIILMNPPFVSWEQMNKDSRDVAKQILNISVKGKPNLASAFLYKSIHSLNKDGIIGCVIPSSLLTMDAYKKLRDELFELISINIIGKLGNFIFENALTDVSFIIGQKPKSDIVPLILWTKNEKGVAQNAILELRKMHYSQIPLINRKNFSIYKPLKFPFSNDNWKPISYTENELYKNLERYIIDKRLIRIQDIFNVQQGIRSGNNSVFKISKKEFSGLPQKEKRFFRPVVDNESIKKGAITLRNYIWFPYSLKDGSLLIKTEKELNNYVPTFYKTKLLPNKEILQSRIKPVPNWWSLSDRAPRLLPLKPIVVSSEFGNSNSFAFDKDGIFAVERGNAWLPKRDFVDIDYNYFYLGIFFSPFFDTLLSIYSKELAGGNWYDLGKKYTSSIPIPFIRQGKISSDESLFIHSESPIFKNIAQFGKDITDGLLINKDNLNSDIKKFIYNIE